MRTRSTSEASHTNATKPFFSVQRAIGPTFFSQSPFAVLSQVETEAVHAESPAAHAVQRKCAACEAEKKILPQLEIGPVDDPLETEADVMADHVVRRQATGVDDDEGQAKPLQAKAKDTAPPAVQRKCAACEAEKKILPQLEIGPVDDPLETEADVMAAHVVRRQAAHMDDDERQAKPLQAKAEDTASSESTSRGLETALADANGSGAPLASHTRDQMEEAFGADFSAVRVHTGAASASMSDQIGARAFTYGTDIHFNDGEFAPGTERGTRLLAHELTHVVQQNSGVSRASREEEAEKKGYEPTTIQARTIQQQDSATVVRRQRDTTIEIEVVGQRDSYSPPGTSETYHVGDAAGPAILMQIEDQFGGRTTFRWFNFAAGEAVEGTAADWRFRTFATAMFANPDFVALGRRLSAADWRRLWPNPMPALLDMHERGVITLPDKVILAGYQGMIFQESLRSLAANEREVGALLDAPDRVQRLQEYATSLREASLVRDALVRRLDDVRRSRVQAHSFTFGIAGNIINTDPYRQMRLASAEAEAESNLQFWLGIFPLLTRLQTSEIRSTRVEQELQGIKASITSTRAELMRAQVGRGSLDLMDLDVVRARLQSQLGSRAAKVIEAEDKSRRRWAIAGGAAMLALSIGLLFLPGGIFIDAAIGIAMAATAVDRAIALGHAANTGLNLDEGLASQATAHAAEFSAVLAVAGAVLGAGVAGFRIFRFASALRSVRAATAGVELGSQVRIARALVGHPELARALRSTGELQELAGKLGLRLTPAELQALRQTIYHMQGVAALGSRERLRTFLDLVWSNRQTIRNGDDVYRLYSQVAGNAALTRSQAAYLADLAGIAGSRPTGSVSHIQKVTRMAAGGDQISAEVARAAADAGTLARIRNRFFMFFRAGTTRGDQIVVPVVERIYLNVVADHATEVMQSVVRQVVDHPQNFPGVVAAKLTGPGGVAGRADAIVIYMQDQAASSRVLNWIREYQAANPGRFQAATPQMTEQVLTGVSVGAEPLGAGGASFGGLRSDLIARALTDAANRGLTREQFGALVDQLFRGARINPELPHTNLP